MNPVGVAATDELTATERWRSIPKRWRAVLLVVAAVVAVELGTSLVSGIVGSAPAGGSASSSFGTSSDGVAAFSQLLATRGHHVIRLTEPVSGAAMPAGSTLFIVDPTGWTPGDTSAVAALLAGGGHVVLAGQPPDAALLSVMFRAGEPPTWQSTAAAGDGTAQPVGSTPPVAGVSDVSTGPIGSFVSTGSAHPILAGRGGLAFAAAGTVASSGEPQSVVVAASTFMTNASLADVDNAAFGLNLAGPASRSVVFDEFDHGYGRTGAGLSGLPIWWREGLILALAAVVIWMYSAARRFGPIERPERQLIPPRVEYASALSSTLASMSDEQIIDVLAPVRGEARALLCRRSNVGVSASDDEVVAAARAFLVPDRVTASVLATPGSSSDAVELGGALAWLETQTGGRT